MATKSSRSKSFNLDDSPGHLLRRCQQYAHDLFTQEVGANGLTPRQFAVLLTVEQNEGLSQTDLVHKTGIDRSTLADMISRLLKRGMLARKRTEADQRANSVKITASGRRALNSALPKVAKAEKNIINALPASKRAEFIRCLTIVADAGVDDEPKAPAKRKAAKKPAARRAKKTTRAKRRR